MQHTDNIIALHHPTRKTQKKTLTEYTHTCKEHKRKRNIKSSNTHSTYVVLFISKLVIIYDWFHELFDCFTYLVCLSFFSFRHNTRRRRHNVFRPSVVSPLTSITRDAICLLSRRSSVNLVTNIYYVSGNCWEGFQGQRSKVICVQMCECWIGGGVRLMWKFCILLHFHAVLDKKSSTMVIIKYSTKWTVLVLAEIREEGIHRTLLAPGLGPAYCYSRTYVSAVGNVIDSMKIS